MSNTPLERLRYHVTGAIERGEGQAIIEQRTRTATEQTRDFHYPTLPECCVGTVKTSEAVVTENGALVCTCGNRLVYNLAIGWRVRPTEQPHDEELPENPQTIEDLRVALECEPLDSENRAILEKRLHDEEQGERHTPLPWETSVSADGWDVCEAGAGDMIADLSGCGNQREQEANAKLIVRAVNSHDALVEAAREALAYIGGDGEVQQQLRAALATNDD